MGTPLITPSSNIIGSKPKALEVKSKTYAEEKEYNSNINKHPEMLSRLVLKDNYIMLRMFKYDQEPVSEGGIILQEMADGISEGGRKTSSLVNSPWQSRGVIALMADNLKDEKGFAGQVKVGDIVHHSAKTLYGFHLDKTIEVDNNHGYFLAHVSVIDCIESPFPTNKTI